MIRRAGWRRSSISCARRPRTISRSTSRARCCDGSSGAWRWPGSGDSVRYLDMLRQNPAELELLAKDLLINVTSFFRDPKAFELLGGGGDSRSGPPAPDGPAAADLGCRLQHRRGDLFPRHAFHRGDHGSEAEHQAAGLRLRCRRGSGRSRPRGALSGIDRGGCVAAAACPLLHPGGARLSGRCPSCAGWWCSRSRMCWPIRRSRAST